MKLLQRIRGYLNRPKQTPIDWSQLDGGNLLSESTKASNPKGRIVKAQPKLFTPNTTRKGGRIVKAMPRDLRKMKEAQERTDEQMPVLPKE